MVSTDLLSLHYGVILFSKCIPQTARHTKHLKNLKLKIITVACTSVIIDSLDCYAKPTQFVELCKMWQKVVKSTRILCLRYSVHLSVFINTIWNLNAYTEARLVHRTDVCSTMENQHLVSNYTILG